MAASLVSPIVIVVVVVIGLASFAIPDYGLAAAVRLNRFVFEALHLPQAQVNKVMYP